MSVAGIGRQWAWAGRVQGRGVVVGGWGVTLTATTPTVTPLATTTPHTRPAEFWAVDKKAPRYVKLLARGVVL